MKEALEADGLTWVLSALARIPAPGFAPSLVLFELRTTDGGRF